MYFNAGNRVQTDGRCIGTLWMCNPGGKSIGPQLWGKLRVDDTMRVVLRIVDRAQVIAASKGRGAAADEYIQVLNLFYVCDPNAFRGRATYEAMSTRYSERPDRLARFTWIAWGQDPDPSWLPSRAVLNALPSPFFYSKAKGSLIVGVPRTSDYPMHPRAFPIHDPINAPEAVAQRISRHL